MAPLPAFCEVRVTCLLAYVLGSLLACVLACALAYLGACVGECTCRRERPETVFLRLLRPVGCGEGEVARVGAGGGSGEESCRLGFSAELMRQEVGRPAAFEEPESGYFGAAASRRRATGKFPAGIFVCIRYVHFAFLLFVLVCMLG